MLSTGQVVCGDCLEIMKTWPDKCIDACICDPPYDARTHRGAKADSVAAGLHCDGIEFASFTPAQQRNLVQELLRLSRRWILIFCTFEQIAAYADAAGTCWVRTGVWDRVNPAPQISGDRPGQAADAIAIIHPLGRKQWNGGGHSAIWRYMPECGQKQHPTQKPLSLMRHLITQFTNENELILDCFAGSGATLAAAEQLNRRWIGIEISAEYCEIARRRTAQRGLAL